MLGAGLLLLLFAAAAADDGTCRASCPPPPPERERRCESVLVSPLNCTPAGVCDADVRVRNATDATTGCPRATVAIEPAPGSWCERDRATVTCRAPVYAVRCEPPPPPTTLTCTWTCDPLPPCHELVVAPLDADRHTEDDVDSRYYAASISLGVILSLLLVCGCAYLSWSVYDRRYRLWVLQRGAAGERAVREAVNSRKSLLLVADD
jgi:hypothetical protein